MSSSVKFICDAMLGRLAKKLRLLGFDTLYHRGDNTTFVEFALSENRIPITKNTQLANRKAFKKRGLKVIFPDSNDYHEQLKVVLNAIEMKVAQLLKDNCRCSLCNKELMLIEKITAQKSVPAYVLIHCSSFYVCPVCLRIYWSGTHIEHFVKDMALIESCEKK